MPTRQTFQDFQVGDTVIISNDAVNQYGVSIPGSIGEVEERFYRLPPNSISIRFLYFPEGDHAVPQVFAIQKAHVVLLRRAKGGEHNEAG